jgi:hypothetical protein
MDQVIVYECAQGDENEIILTLGRAGVQATVVSIGDHQQGRHTQAMVSIGVPVEQVEEARRVLIAREAESPPRAASHAREFEAGCLRSLALGAVPTAMIAIGWFAVTGRAADVPWAFLAGLWLLSPLAWMILAALLRSRRDDTSTTR